MAEMLMETYLRQQVEKGEYGVAIIQAQIALDIAAYIEKHRQPERKTGRWVMKPDPYGFFDEIPVCSECGCTTRMRETYKFCPNCGADMRGEQSENN